MYDNIGGKIKGLAETVFIVEAVGAVITGIVLLAKNDDLILAGLLTLVCGPIVAYIGSWILYAFGELVEDVHAMRNKYYLIAEEQANRETEEKAKHEAELKAQREATEKARQEAEEKAKEHSAVNTPDSIKKEPKEAPLEILPCPQCGEDLSFMGWDDTELHTTLTCPLCGKEILLKQ